jgi:leucyl aminopeptidase
LVENQEFKPDIGRVATLYFLPGVAAPVVMLAGCGARSAWDRGAAFRAASTASRALTEKQRECIVFALDSDLPSDIAESAVVGSLIGMQGPGLYQKQKKRHAPNRLYWWNLAADPLAAGEIVGQAVNLTRRLVNEPPQTVNPESFAATALQVAQATGMECEVWDESRLQVEQCGALLAVARGSSCPPRLVILRHAGAASADDPWLTLVGKGVTFDSGGLSLKPSDAMKTMKCDMAGAASVLGAMQAIARLRLPVNVMGLAGLVENMPGASAYKLGDVLTARNGATIEVHNTDAEGRLVLADVLSVAVDRGATKIVDLATLTGACMVALGTDVAGVMTNCQAWCDEVRAAADRCGERVWQLPMDPEFGEQIKGEVADFKNVGEGRWAGAITAAKLLEQFVSDRPWTHIDIAGPAFLEKPKPWLDAGGTGALVRTLIDLARAWS